VPEWFSESGSRLMPEACQGIHNLTFLLCFRYPPPVHSSWLIFAYYYRHIQPDQPGACGLPDPRPPPCSTLAAHTYPAYMLIFNQFRVQCRAWLRQIRAVVEGKSPTTASSYSCRQSAQDAEYFVTGATCGSFIYRQARHLPRSCGSACIYRCPGWDQCPVEGND